MLLLSAVPQISIAHDLGGVISTIIKRFHQDNLKYEHFAVAERYYSLQEMLDTIEKVPFPSFYAASPREPQGKLTPRLRQVTGRPVRFVPLPVWGAKDSVYDFVSPPRIFIRGFWLSLEFFSASEQMFKYNADPEVSFYPEGSFPDKRLAVRFIFHRPGCCFSV